ncbi:hypothetical protein HME9304_01397 [Flagellimonas maritima]|uniref:TolC family protein n=1 Tax=Flagellimonas maritima TaxID=1383885 RepID=A0A2Z4LSZ4_9FLAO|nr:TolC family protein [Allomuricauda aurantiaca]AWX44397.1 hypothetical protein HME9304_01397 [Allomuricauda aurantiaca]
MRNIRLTACGLAFFLYTMAVAQDMQDKKITLQEAYQWANTNYPLIDDTEIIDRLEAVNLEIIKRDGLPSLSAKGRAQYQTENFEIPLGSTTLEAPLETWNAALNLNYDVYDGGMKSAQRSLEKASANVERQSLQVQLRTLKDRVNNLVFATTLSRKQDTILQNSLEDIRTNIETLQAGYDNGTVLESEVSKLKVRRLELLKDQLEVRGNTDTYISLLEQLTGKTLSEDVQFVTPEGLIVTAGNDIKRPENELYDSQKSLIAAREASIAASTKPKISLYAESGVGNPNPVNFADFETSTYSLGGVQLNWSLFNFGKSKTEREKLKIQQEQIEVDREVFLFDLENQRKEYLKEMETIASQIENNEQIVALRTEILRQSKVQLDNGIINSSEYITQLNAKINAEQQLELNRIELLQTKINYLTLIGQL